MNIKLIHDAEDYDTVGMIKNNDDLCNTLGALEKIDSFIVDEVEYRRKGNITLNLDEKCVEVHVTVY